MNHWCGSGNVSTEVQIRYTTSGTPVARFNLAIRGVIIMNEYKIMIERARINK